MTIIELLVILGILSALLGISIGVYRELSSAYQLPATASRVTEVLRAARNYSRSTGLPSRVLVEPDPRDALGVPLPGRISLFAYQEAAAWSFEDFSLPEDEDTDVPAIAPKTSVNAAFGERGAIYGEVYPARGRIGYALEFVDNGAAVVMPANPRHYSPRGFSIEAWVLFQQPPLDPDAQKVRDKKGAWRDPRRADYYAVVSLPSCYEIGLLGDGAMYVEIGAPENPDGHYLAMTRGGVVVGDRWTHVRVSYDSVSLAVEVDGIPRRWIPDKFERVTDEDWPPFPDAVPRPESDAALCVSRPDRMFRGIIDEARVRVALAPEPLVLDGGVRILDGTQLLFFDSRGSLDPREHDKPVVIRLAKEASAATVEPDYKPGQTAVRNTPIAENGSDDSGDDGDEDMEGGDAEDAARLAEARRAEGDVRTALREYLASAQAEKDALAAGAVPRDTALAAEPGRGDEQEPAVTGAIEVITVDLTGAIRTWSSAVADRAARPKRTAEQPATPQGDVKP